ncbi:MAG: energy transducer TonB [Bacteroidia bacterium]|nr:energy transducer TonB [Bacteroidia bacterium]
MKKESNENRKKKDFIKLPEYPGGKEELNKFIKENLRYPADAVNNRIEGFVHISYDVDHNGEVSNEKILRGIGHECDEEALRLVRMLKYNKTYNRGMRVKKTMRLKIDFKIGGGISYSFVRSDIKKDEQDEFSKQPVPEVYNYTITL